MSELDKFQEQVLTGIDQSFANGFEMAKVRAMSFLTERADWLRKEYLNGGNFEYLRAKEEDCRYAAQVISEMQPPPNLVTHLPAPALNS